MAFTNQTTHYGLPLPIGSDKSTWLDNNTAFAAIDAAIYQASTDAAAAAGDITTIQGDITSLQSGKQNVLTFDAAPTSGSTNPVTSGGVYDAINKGSVTISSDGVKTYSQLFNALFALIDGSKISDNSVVKLIQSGVNFVYHIDKYTPSTEYSFERNAIAGSNVNHIAITINNSTSSLMIITLASDGTVTVTDNSSVVPPVGMTYILEY